MSRVEFCIIPPNPYSVYRTMRTETHCHRHEIFYGTANRKKSIKDGLVVFLTPEMHNMSDRGVHFNRRLDLELKQIGQKAWMEYYGKTIKDFIKEYGRNYL